MKELSNTIAPVNILAAAYHPSGSDKKDMNKLIENGPMMLKQAFSLRVRRSEFYNLRYGEYMVGGENNDVFKLGEDVAGFSVLRIGCSKHGAHISGRRNSTLY